MITKAIELRILIRAALCTLLTVVGACRTTEADAPRALGTKPQHPLDPLTADEIFEAVAILRAAGHVGADARFPEFVLDEPRKHDVLAWRTGDPLPRKARIVVLDRKPSGSASYEALVDLSAQRVESWQPIASGQPMLLEEEYARAETAVRADARWRAAMAARGITDLDGVFLDVWAPGEKPVEGAGEARVCRVLSFWCGTSKNPYGPPIEGVVAAVDLWTDRVLEVRDTGVRPMATARTDFYDPEVTGPDRPALPPLDVTTPSGPGFATNGRELSWERWRMRCSFTPREGLVLHQVGWQDGERLRPIVYRASLSEMMVPYADPSESWSWRSAFDEGEYGLGRLAAPLLPGANVPAHARLFDTVAADDRGEPRVQTGVVAVWERDAGFLWSHHDFEHGTAARRARELVVGFLATIGNYDYACNWVFSQDGVMSFEATLTGSLLTKGVDSQRCAVCDVDAAVDADAAEEQRTGTLVAANVLAPNHQHLINLRLDLDVDGTENLAKQLDVRALPAGPANPRGNAFGVERTPLATERAARCDPSPKEHRSWEIANLETRNATGHPAGYALVPGATAAPFLLPDTALAQLGAFAQHTFWVTRHHDDELFAAGRYPGQRKTTDGLSTFGDDDESLRGDVVVWYTIGVTHIPRPEEFPIMSATRVGFSLQPVGFFDRNPGLDVPQAASVQRDRR